MSGSIVTVRPNFAKTVLKVAGDLKGKSEQAVRSENFARRNDCEIRGRGGGLGTLPTGLVGVNPKFKGISEF